MTTIVFALNVVLAVVAGHAPQPIERTVPAVSPCVTLTTPAFHEPLDEFLATYRLSRRAL